MSSTHDLLECAVAFYKAVASSGRPASSQDFVRHERHERTAKTGRTRLVADLGVVLPTPPASNRTTTSDASTPSPTPSTCTRCGEPLT